MRARGRWPRACFMADERNLKAADAGSPHTPPGNGSLPTRDAHVRTNPILTALPHTAAGAAANDAFHTWPRYRVDHDRERTGDRVAHIVFRPRTVARAASSSTGSLRIRRGCLGQRPGRCPVHAGGAERVRRTLRTRRDPDRECATQLAHPHGRPAPSS